MSTTSRSLADDIRGRSDRELIDLVLARPDLARPAPADLSSLAARASTKASAQRAIEALDRGHLQVLEALVVAGDPAPLPEVLQLLGTDDEATVEAHVADLWTAALLWRGADGTHVVRTVPDVLGTLVGLGPPFPERRPGATAPAGDSLRAAIAAAPAAARAILDRLTWGPAVAVLPEGGAGATAARWLLEHHLLVAASTDRVALPREVALLLREGRLHRETTLLAPELTSRPVSAQTVDDVAGGAANEMLSRIDELASAWGAEPPRVLRAGGLSVRDLKRTQERLDVPAGFAGFLVEIAYAAGLVADDGEIVPVWAPTAEVDEWSASEGGRRWASLAIAWLTTTRASHRVGTRVADAPVNALGPDVQWPAIRAIRREVLSGLAGLPPGHAADADALRARLLWRRPLRPSRLLAEAVGGVLREAEWLGVTGRGALSTPGRTLLGHHVSPGGTDTAERGAGDIASSRESLAAAMSAYLPAPIDHILLQADLTAVAPGPLVGSLAAFMRLASDVESRGGATVHRFTSGSVRRALDAGWTADDVLETLRRSSSTAVPQPLEYLVSDVARKHGVTRVGSGAAYVRSEDRGVLEALLAARELGPLALRRIAPTVLVSSADPGALADMLREHGFSPVLEGRDGGVVVAEPARRRAGSRHRTAPPALSPIDEAFTQALVSGLRVAEANADVRRAHDVARLGPTIPATDPVVSLALLRDAIADRHGVWIGVSDRYGATTRHLVHPRRVEAGRVYATDETGREQSYSVHRITGATLEAPST
ncbi:MAG: helicase-associated domain-containing protein [Micrococcales bacterium]|nr:helicase-associated domain-containing protein [Micrococcales bacterium]